jgi:hypothetical protein
MVFWKTQFFYIGKIEEFSSNRSFNQIFFKGGCATSSPNNPQIDNKKNFPGKTWQKYEAIKICVAFLVIQLTIIILLLVDE